MYSWFLGPPWMNYLSMQRILVCWTKINKLPPVKALNSGEKTTSKPKETEKKNTHTHTLGGGFNPFEKY